MSDAAIFNDASEVIRKALENTHKHHPAKTKLSQTAFETALKQLV
jgi:Arc/MetJ-type ribon-helix-helix transcriptional regulator